MSKQTTPFCADLHCHSTVSDGLLAPDVVARRAKERGVTLWSLTDHDELAGQVLARQTAQEIGLDYPVALRSRSRGQVRLSTSLAWVLIQKMPR